MIRRALLVVVLGGVLALLVPGVASAHPLGNFTINQASAVRISPDHVDIDHVVDMAEIRTFQAREDIDRNHDGRPSAGEGRRWAAGECTRIARSLGLTVDAHAVPLARGAARVTSPAGQAGLPTLRLVCRLRAGATVTGGEHRVRLVNRYERDRIGWREI